MIMVLFGSLSETGQRQKINQIDFIVISHQNQEKG